MRRLEERRGSWTLFRVKWSLVLAGVGVLIGLAAVLDPILAPFNVRAALIAGALFVVVGYAGWENDAAGHATTPLRANRVWSRIGLRDALLDTEELVGDEILDVLQHAEAELEAGNEPSRK